MYVKYPLSLHNVEDLLFERGIDICHETGRLFTHRAWPLLMAVGGLLAAVILVLMRR